MNRSSAFFILIAASLFAYIYLVESKEKGTKEKEAGEKKLFELTASKIDRLTITHDELTIELLKKGSEWKILKPITSNADLSAVEQVLSELEFVESRRTIPSKEIEDLDSTLKQWGLSTPATKITAQGDKKSYELIVGRKIAVSDLYYAKKSMDRLASVELISSFSRNNFEKKLNDLRSKEILKFTSSDVRKISLKQSHGESAIIDEKELLFDKELWTLQKPIKTRGDREKINSWISNALGLKVTRFISDDSSNLNVYGLSSPKTQLSFGFDQHSTQTLLLGTTTTDQPTEIYAKLLESNTVFSIKSEAIEKLLLATPEWRDKHLLPSLLQTEIEGLKINSKNKPVAFQNENKKWTLTGQPEFLVDENKIDQVLKSIQELKTTQFVKDTQGDLKTYGLDKPSLVITLDRKKGEERSKIEIRFGKTDKNNIFVMNSLEPFIYAIPSNFNAEWPNELWQWRSLHILNDPATQFNKIQISDRKGIRSILTLDEKGNWKSENPSQSLNPKFLEPFLAKLSNLQGIRWVGNSSSPTYELTQPHLKIEIQTSSGSKTLKLGALLPTGGRVAQIENTDLYFEITRPDFQSLNEDLTSPLPPSPEVKSETHSKKSPE